METLEQKIHRLPLESKKYIEQVVQNLLDKQKANIGFESLRHDGVENTPPANDNKESDHSSPMVKEPAIDYKSTQRPVRPVITIGLKELHPENVEISNPDVLPLPIELSGLANEIERSKYILRLEDNWDGEGAIKYELVTWVKAVKFISTYAKNIYKISGKVIPTPSIYQGPKGSIDIYWDTEKYYLLINIPSGDDSIANFYGNNRINTHLEGTIDIGSEDKMNCGLLFILENIR